MQNLERSLKKNQNLEHHIFNSVFRVERNAHIKWPSFAAIKHGSCQNNDILHSFESCIEYMSIIINFLNGFVIYAEAWDTSVPKIRSFLSSSNLQAQVAGMVDVWNTMVFRLLPTLYVVIHVNKRNLSLTCAFLYLQPRWKRSENSLL